MLLIERKVTKRKVWTAAAGFAIVYITWEVWIGYSVRSIMVTGMKNETDYSRIMTDRAYQQFNPALRGMKDHTTYDPSLHQIGLIKPVHTFGYAKVWVMHRYDGGAYGFVEPVTLRLRLENWQWKAVDISIEP